MKKPCIIMMCLLFMLSMLVGCHYSIYQANNDINSGGSINSSEDAIGIYETNGFYFIYVDNETGVLYLSNGDGLTPMYNADGTLKMAKQEE